MPDPPAPAERPRVASVAVEVPLAHLDRPFDYAVPAEWAADVRVGCRVTVRFAGRRVGGLVLAVSDVSAHEGRLQPLQRVVSSEPVLSAEVARLARTVADSYAGTLADVLRLAVPKRHARVEAEQTAPASSAGLPAGSAPASARGFAGAAAWSAADAGDDFLAAVRAGSPARVAWTALPGDDWPAAMAVAVAACVDGGRGAVLCLPDRRDVARVDEALTQVLGAGRHVVLTAELGPAARYRAFLAASRGLVPVVIGTRAAAFAPVPDLGLIGIWDDGDDLHAEPRAPYPHAREVLALRAHQQGTALLLAGHARTAEAQLLVTSGWLTTVAAPRETVRAAWPAVQVTGGASAQVDRDPAARAARLPSQALAAVRTGLLDGPVLFQVPRTGYRVRLACQDCRTPAACPVCSGPLAQTGPAQLPSCRWCGREESQWRCGVCGSGRLRAPLLGEERTAEELGRAFPGVPVRRSTGEHVLDTVPAEPAVVVATPGAEPRATGGYLVGVLLDTAVALARPDLRAVEESVRRWTAVAALVRRRGEGGVLVVVGEPAQPPVQALVRGDPAGFAERELAGRHAARMPPAARIATIEGSLAALRPLTDPALVQRISGSGWPQPVEVLGPAPLGDGRARLVVRVPRAAGADLARTLATLQADRSARKTEPLRVVVDPAELG